MAVGDAYVFSGFYIPVLTQISSQSHRLLFSHASAEVKGENMPERTVASTGSRTHNHQVTSPTRSPLSHPSRATYTRLWAPQTESICSGSNDRICFLLKGRLAVLRFNETLTAKVMWRS